jgi:hypothetical protein
VWNGVCGESKDVDESLVSEHKPKLLELISPYELENIYNEDETGLFFGHYQQNYSLLRVKSVPEQNVQRETYSVIVWEYGRRNGKASRDWKSIKTQDVIWGNNKKAWMTVATMEEWLNMFNAKIKKENRNANLFYDLLPNGNSFKCENLLVPSKCNNCVTAHGYVCYLHIQIAPQTISDAIFDFECRKKQLIALYRFWKL